MLYHLLTLLTALALAHADALPAPGAQTTDAQQVAADAEAMVAVEAMHRMRALQQDNSGNGNGNSGDGNGNGNNNKAASDNNAKACFSSDSTVQLADGSVRRMDKVMIGDKILTSVDGGRFETVLGFSHREPKTWAQHVVISTATNSTISLTAPHLLYVGGQLGAASMVQVGDIVSSGRVTSVQQTWKQGTIIPVTWSGDLIVSGTRASVYGSTLSVFFQSFYGIPYIGLRYVAGSPVQDFEWIDYGYFAPAIETVAAVCPGLVMATITLASANKMKKA